MSAMRSALSIVVGVVIVASAAEAGAATFTVTTTAATGAGSLPDALDQANAVVGPHTIEFAIPGTGPHVIATTGPLSLSRQITIDGWTQPGFAGVPQIVLDGSAHISGGVSIIGAAGGGSVVRGLTLTGYDGIAIYINGASNVVVEGNYVGLDATGTIDAGGTSPGVMVDGALGARIGGSTAAQRNVIGGVGNGVLVQGTCNGLVVQGNYIGTNAAGTAAVGNSIGVYLLQSNGTTIAGNLISGNGTGMAMHSGAGGYFYRNWIGLNAAGTSAIPNATGVAVGTPNLHLAGPLDLPSERNVISGNTLTGIHVEGNAAGVRVYNAYVGLDPTGTTAIGNGTGIVLNTGANDAILGSGVAGRGNVISGNTEAGIVIARVTNAQVYGSRIGTTADGTAALGNTGDGINVYDATGATIGVYGGGDGNTIAYNTGYGVNVMAGASAAIHGNSIHDNGLRGIFGDSLSSAAATVVIAEDTGAGTHVSGTFTGQASRTHRLGLFASPVCDPSGTGEGQTPLSSIDVTTGAGGSGTFELFLAQDVGSGNVVTATLVDSVAANTSEFSTCKDVCPLLTLAPDPLPAAEPGVAYSQALTPGGGTGPYAIALVSGTLPPGIAFTGAALSGTPTGASSTPLTFRVEDAAGCVSQVMRTFAVVCDAITIEPDVLPDAIVGVPYAATLTASGGAPPYTYNPTGGGPTWLQLTPSTGALGGTPLEAGTTTLEIGAIDSAGCYAFRTLSVVATDDGPGDPDAGPGPDPDAGPGVDTPDGGGCCSTGGSPGNAAVLVLVVGLVLLRRR